MECGKRGAKVAGDDGDPYTLAQYLAIRDSFADQWQRQGGIESAMIDMLTMAFSLQMHWSKIAHERVTRTHDAQRDQMKRFESSGWKSSYQSEADSVDHAHRLADGYNERGEREPSLLEILEYSRLYDVPVELLIDDKRKL